MIWATDYEQAKKQLKEELKLNKELKRDLLLNEAEIEHLQDVIRVYEQDGKANEYMTTKQFTIYQLTNTDKLFRGYNPKNFTMDDYKVVATGEIETTDEDVLEDIFKSGNVGEIRANNPKMHSISVSDVIEVDGTKYYVENFGFVNLALSK